MLYVFCTSAASLETTVATRSCSATVRETKHGRISYIYFFFVCLNLGYFTRIAYVEREFILLYFYLVFVCLFFLLFSKNPVRFALKQESD